MLNNNPSAGSSAEWLRYAHSDLEIARVTPSPDMMLESLCFHAQQTAEKALKAEETIQTLRNPPQLPENQSEETIKPPPCERCNSG